MEKKTIVARAEVLAGKEKEFLAAAAKLVAGTRAEDGNISYNCYQSPEMPTKFIFYEEYKDDNAMSVHAASAHFKAFGVAIQPLLAGELLIEKF